MYNTRIQVQRNPCQRRSPTLQRRKKVYACMCVCVYACVCVSVHVYVHAFSFRVSEDTLLLAHLAYSTSPSNPNPKLTLN